MELAHEQNKRNEFPRDKSVLDFLSDEELHEAFITMSRFHKTNNFRMYLILFIRKNTLKPRSQAYW